MKTKHNKSDTKLNVVICCQIFHTKSTAPSSGDFCWLAGLDQDSNSKYVYKKNTFERFRPILNIFLELMWSCGQNKTKAKIKMDLEMRSQIFAKVAKDVVLESAKYFNHIHITGSFIKNVFKSEFASQLSFLI